MASYWSDAIQGTNFYRWSGSTNASDCMAQGGYSAWASGGSQAGRVYFSGLNNIDLNRYKITAVNLSMHFSSTGHNSKKWIQFYFSSWADNNYIAIAFRTTAEAYNADISHSWYDEATLLNFEKSLKAGNCYLCCYNGETAGSSNYSTNYLKIDRIYISYNYEDRENLKLQYYKNEVWNYPSDAYYYNENKPQPAQEAPSFALTSNDGFRGYSCGATTYWGAGDEAYQVFNKDYTSANAGWASTSNITEPQTLYLNLPKKGYLKSLVIYNRVWTSDANVRGPYTVNIKAKTNKDDDETWLITTVTNLPGAISGRGTTIIIPEEYQNTLIESIHIEITDWHTKGTSGTHVCIGEIIPYIQYSTITVPPIALTSNAGTDGYSCGASSIFLATEDAYKAFDFNLAHGYSWGSISDTTTSHSLWLNLPHPGKVQSVTITNRNYSLVNGPISIYIKGKKNINDTETVALSDLITDLPGSTILASTTIQVEEPYNQIEVQQITVEVIDWDGKSSSYNVGIGEMSAEVIYPWHKIKKVLHYNPEPKAITVPPVALTSNSGTNGYSCEASSTLSDSGFEVFHAFDKVSGSNNGWASSAIERLPFICLNLPKLGCVKSITISNRAAHADGVLGPKKILIKGKTNLNSRKEILLCSSEFSLPGSTANAITTLTIEEGYNNIPIQQIKVEVTDWDAKDSYYCFISEMSAEVTYSWS